MAQNNYTNQIGGGLAPQPIGMPQVQADPMPLRNGQPTDFSNMPDAMRQYYMSRPQGSGSDRGQSARRNDMTLRPNQQAGFPNRDMAPPQQPQQPRFDQRQYEQQQADRSALMPMQQPQQRMPVPEGLQGMERQFGQMPPQQMPPQFGQQPQLPAAPQFGQQPQFNYLPQFGQQQPLLTSDMGMSQNPMNPDNYGNISMPSGLSGLYEQQNGAQQPTQNGYGGKGGQSQQPQYSQAQGSGKGGS